MNTPPKISVIVPVYKVEKYLPKCIDSILAQTFTDFELLLIDDGSPDNSGAICDEYARKDSRIRVFHKDNGGVSSARNLGLDEAKGEWIAFVDGDDWIDADMYEKMCEASNQVDVVICHFRKVSQTNIVEESIFKTSIARNEDTIPDLISASIGLKNNSSVSYFTSVCKCLIKARVIDGVRFESVKIMEDKLFLIRLLFRSSGVNILKESYYNYRSNIDSVMHNFKASLKIDMSYIISQIKEVVDVNMGSDLYKREINNYILSSFILLLYNQGLSDTLYKEKIKPINEFAVENNIRTLLRITEIHKIKNNWMMVLWRLKLTALMFWIIKLKLMIRR